MRQAGGGRQEIEKWKPNFKYNIHKAQKTCHKRYQILQHGALKYRHHNAPVDMYIKKEKTYILKYRNEYM